MVQVLITLKPTWFSAGSYFKLPVTNPLSHFPIRCGCAYATAITPFPTGYRYRTGSRFLSPCPHQQPQKHAVRCHRVPADRSPLTNIHAQVHAEVHILRPRAVGWIFAEHGEDAAVEVGLAGRLVVTGHGDDGSARAVPGHQVCGPGRKRDTR